MHKSNAGNEFWDKEKENVLRLYLKEELSATEIGKIYGCYGSTIINHLKRWDIKIRKRRANAFYKIDVNYFHNIDTEEKHIG